MQCIVAGQFELILLLSGAPRGRRGPTSCWRAGRGRSATRAPSRGTRPPGSCWSPASSAAATSHTSSSSPSSSSAASSCSTSSWRSSWTTSTTSPATPPSSAPTTWASSSPHGRTSTPAERECWKYFFFYFEIFFTAEKAIKAHYTNALWSSGSAHSNLSI